MPTLLHKLTNIYNLNMDAYQKKVGFLLRASRATKKTNNLSILHDTIFDNTLTKVMKEFSKKNDKDVRV